MNKKTKSRAQEVIDQYIKISRKLNRLASIRDCHKLGLSADSIKYHFNGKISNLKDSAIRQAPYLEDLQVQQELNISDLTKLRLDGLKKQTGKQNTQLLKTGNVLDFIQQFSEHVFSGKVKSVKKKKSNVKINRALNLLISDIHFGSNVKKEETGISNYGPLEEARRFAAVVKETIEYKQQHRKDTKLNLVLLGDLIHGKLHDPQDGAELAEQVCRVIHVLSQGIAHLAEHFPEIEVYCQTGNHGRMTSRHPGRAMQGKADSFESIIYYSLKTALKNLKNVNFHIHKTPYGSYEVFGEKVMYTHGDTVLNPGYPGSSINVKSLEVQINKINASLSDRQEYKAILVGHVHTASQTYLPNGAVMITNGALLDPDSFAVSIGILEAQAGQMLFESVPNYIVGDTRFIRVGKQQDEDSSLDKIIKPWESFNLT